MKAKRKGKDGPRQRKRPTARAKQAKFLKAYATCGNITTASEIAGTNRTDHYLWLVDAAYAQLFEQADKAACEALEQEARRRGVTGWDEPVWYKGEECGAVRKFSDTLLIFMMKGAMPDKYRDNINVQGEIKVDLGTLVAAARKRANGESEQT